MKIDLHGKVLIEALDEILIYLEECKAIGDKHVEIIHGHHHGQVLKNHIQSDRFIREIENSRFTLVRKNSPNKGTTCFELKLKNVSI